ncbi:MAG TPA: TolC family protein [Gemmatimonadaceae bacterium]|jgi:cobalt-zinc-cadmium efflux system outer membrane protein
MRLFLGLCALAAQTGVALAQTRTEPSPSGDSLHLSRRQVVAEALTHNAQLEIAREQTAQARARRVSAIAVPDPSATVGYDQLGGPLTLRGAPSKPAALELDVPFPDKFRLNNRAGWADIHASESNYHLTQQTVALQASATYDSLLVALQHRGNLTEARDLANDFLKRTQIRFDAGTAAKLDVIQAQVAVAQASTDLIGNERDVANAQASLNRTLGRVIGSPISPTDTLDLPPSLPDSSTIDQIALGNRPELKILENQQLGARASTGLAKEFWLPDLTFAAGRDYAVPGPVLFTTGLAFPLPVFYWSHKKGDISQAEHFERELAATYRDTRAQVTQDVRSAYANANTAMKQAIFIRDELVPAARDAYRVASTSYTLGGSSALEVLTARGALLQALSQLADALADANTARADLDRALGFSPPGARP